MDKIASFHLENYKTKPDIICQVPGVCTLMGAFADFCKGYSITGTGTLGLRIALSRRDDEWVRIYNATRNDKKQFSYSQMKYRKEDKWANFIKGALNILLEENIMPLQGLDITIKGALLFCDNLTISVALTAGLLTALNSEFSLSLDKATIIRLTYAAITKFSNLNCRFRDIITLMYAEEGNVFSFDLQTMNYTLRPFTFNRNDAYCLVVDPNVPPQILREEIEEKRQDAHDCCKKLSTSLPKEYKLRNYPIKDLKSHIIAGLSEHERRTCEYVITETISTQKGMKALESDDAVSFAKQLSSIYFGMRDVFEITCPEVDWLIKRAGETEGIFGASLVSNGATGSIFLVLDKKGEESYQQVLNEYKRIFDFTPETRRFLPGSSIKVIKN
ncbi:MAG: hypothetical protein PUC01_07285 [Spirochaetales bacterium]|nr:hypothetical protein [Spirochaetales bacterium]